MKNNKKMLEKLKKGICILTAATCIGTFSGCNNMQSEVETTQSSETTTVENQEKEVEQNNIYNEKTLNNVQLWQYTGRNDKVNSIFVQINYTHEKDLFNVDACICKLVDLFSNTVIASNAVIHSPGKCNESYKDEAFKRARQDFIKSYGSIIHKENIYSLLVKEYGEKSSYSLVQINKLMDKIINNSEVKYLSSGLQNLELWVTQTDKEDSPILVNVYQYTDYTHDDLGLIEQRFVKINSFETGNVLVLKQDSTWGLFQDALYKEAEKEYEKKFGDIIKQYKFYPELAKKYGEKDEYTLTEIKSLITSLMNKENKQNANNQNDEDSIDKLLNNIKSKEKHITIVQKQVGSDEHTAEKICYGLTKVTTNDDKNYLINNEESAILLKDYDSIGSAIFSANYFRFVDDKQLSTNVGLGKGYLIEIEKNGIKYLVDADDFTQIVAEGYKECKLLNKQKDDESIELIYLDGTKQTIYTKDIKVSSSKVLIK